MHLDDAFMGHSWVSMEGNYRNQAEKYSDRKWLSLNKLDYKLLIVYSLWARSGGGGRRFKSFHSDQRSITFPSHSITFSMQLDSVIDAIFSQSILYIFIITLDLYFFSNT